MDAQLRVTDAPPELERSRAFPPWATKILILWMIGFLVLSVLIGGLLGVVVVLADIWFDLRLDNPEALLIARLPAQAIYGGAVFLFILSRLRRAGSSLCALWGFFRVDLDHLGLALFSGAVLMSAAAMASKLLTGEVSIPPTDPAPLDWRLLLGAEVLVNALVMGVMEEMAFRGLLYRSLRRHTSVEKAALLSAFIFTASHLQYLIYPSHLVFIFLIGIIAALFLEHTRSLNPCIAFHFSANTTVSVIYYLTYF